MKWEKTTFGELKAGDLFSWDDVTNAKTDFTVSNTKIMIRGAVGLDHVADGVADYTVYRLIPDVSALSVLEAILVFLPDWEERVEMANECQTHPLPDRLHDELSIVTNQMRNCIKTATDVITKLKGAE